MGSLLKFGSELNFCRVIDAMAGAIANPVMIVYPTCLFYLITLSWYTLVEAQKNSLIKALLSSKNRKSPDVWVCFEDTQKPMNEY